jgi:hypothetical protein
LAEADGNRTRPPGSAVGLPGDPGGGESGFGPGGSAGAVLAEADGNRTRPPGIARRTGFEDENEASMEVDYVLLNGRFRRSEALGSQTIPVPYCCVRTQVREACSRNRSSRRVRGEPRPSDLKSNLRCGIPGRLLNPHPQAPMQVRKGHFRQTAD